MKSPRVRPRSPTPTNTNTLKRTKLEHGHHEQDDSRLNDKGKGKVKEEPIQIDLTPEDEERQLEGAIDEEEGPNCSICLQILEDRTVLPTCSHEFCFECILVWTEQSRRCPLCNQAIGEYLIHSIRSRYDYRKHFLPPLRGQSPAPLPSFASSSNTRNPALQGIRRRRRQERQWGRRDPDMWEEQDRLERSIEKRRWVYHWGLYAKHVASNAYTKYRPYPTPTQFAASQELISRTTIFLRRELQVWEGLDVEFLTSFTISIMKSLDIRSEGAIKLLAEFLDMDDEAGERKNAQHFAHEVYTYVRSPYRDLFVYDTVVQYDEPSDIPPPPDQRRRRRWREHNTDRPFTVRDRSEQPEDLPKRRSRSHSRTRGIERTRKENGDRSSADESWSPSGRRYPGTREREMMAEDEGSPPPAFRRKNGKAGNRFEIDVVEGTDRHSERGRSTKSDRGRKDEHTKRRDGNCKVERRRHSISRPPTPTLDTRANDKGKGMAIGNDNLRPSKRHRRRSTSGDFKGMLDLGGRSNRRRSGSRERVLAGGDSSQRDVGLKDQDQKRARDRSHGERNSQKHESRSDVSRDVGDVSGSGSHTAPGRGDSAPHVRRHDRSRGDDRMNREERPSRVDETCAHTRRSATPTHRGSLTRRDSSDIHEARQLYSDSLSRASNIDGDGDVDEVKEAGSDRRGRIDRGGDGNHSMQDDGVEVGEKRSYSSRSGSRFMAETRTNIGHPAFALSAISRHLDKHPPSSSRSDSHLHRNGLGNSQRGLRNEEASVRKTIGRGTIDDKGSSAPINGNVDVVPRDGSVSAGTPANERDWVGESSSGVTNRKGSNALLDGIPSNSEMPTVVQVDGRRSIINDNGLASELRILGMGGGRNTPSQSASASTSRRLLVSEMTGPGEGSISQSMCTSSERNVLSNDRFSLISMLAPSSSSDHIPRQARNRTLRDSIQAHLLARSNFSSVRNTPLLPARIPAESGNTLDRNVRSKANLSGLQLLPEAKGGDGSDKISDCVGTPPTACATDVPSLLTRLSDPVSPPSSHVSPIGTLNNTDVKCFTSLTSLNTTAGIDASSAMDGEYSASSVGSSILSGIRTTRRHSEASDLQIPIAAQLHKSESSAVNSTGHREAEASYGNNQADTQFRLTIPMNVDGRASRTRDDGMRTCSIVRSNPGAPAVELVCYDDMEVDVTEGRVSLLSNGHLGSKSTSGGNPSSHLYDEMSLNTDDAEVGGSRDAKAICPLKFSARLSNTAPTHECAASAQVEGIPAVSREPQEREFQCPSSVSLMSSSGASKEDIPRASGISNRTVHHVGSPMPSSMYDIPIRDEAPSKSVIATNSTSSSGVDMRARLLERLQKEKAKTHSPRPPESFVESGGGSHAESATSVGGGVQLDTAPHATSVLDTISSRFDNTRRRSETVPLDTSGKGPGLDTSSKGVAETDANAMEARLRARAQLRVRLAAEKRVGGIVSSSAAT